MATNGIFWGMDGMPLATSGIVLGHLSWYNKNMEGNESESTRPTPTWRDPRGTPEPYRRADHGTQNP